MAGACRFFLMVLLFSFLCEEVSAQLFLFQRPPCPFGYEERWRFFGFVFCACDQNPSSTVMVVTADGTGINDVDITGPTLDSAVVLSGDGNYRLTYNRVCGFFGTGLNTNTMFEKDGFVSQTVSIDGPMDTVVLESAVNAEVPEPIRFLANPQAKVRRVGENVKLCCLATAVPSSLTYQWQKDGVDIPGETNQMLILTSLQLDQSGYYRCEATNEEESAFSSPAYLEVLDDSISDDELYERYLTVIPTGSTCLGSRNECLRVPCRISGQPTEEKCIDEETYCVGPVEFEVTGICFFGNLITASKCGCTRCTSDNNVHYAGVVKDCVSEMFIDNVEVLVETADGIVRNTTGEDGRFLLSILRPQVERVLLRFNDLQRNRYYSSTLFVDPVTNVQLEICMVPFPSPISVTVTANTPTNIPVNIPGLSLGLPANSIANPSNGEQFNGNVDIFFRSINPAEAISTSGTFETRNDGSLRQLISAGVLAISIPDFTITNPLSVQIDSNEFGIDPTFNIYGLNPLTGIWDLATPSANRKKRQVNDITGEIDLNNFDKINIDRIPMDGETCYYKIIIIGGAVGSVSVRSVSFFGRTFLPLYARTNQQSDCFMTICNADLTVISVRSGPLRLRTVLNPQLFNYVLTDTDSNNSQLYTTKAECDNAADSTFRFFKPPVPYEIALFYTPSENNALDMNISPIAWHQNEVQEPNTPQYRVCYMKLNILYGEDVDLSNSAVYAASFALDPFNQHLGIREGVIDTNTNTTCVEYRCTGIVDRPFNARMSNTSVITELIGDLACPDFNEGNEVRQTRNGMSNTFFPGLTGEGLYSRIFESPNDLGSAKAMALAECQKNEEYFGEVGCFNFGEYGPFA